MNLYGERVYLRPLKREDANGNYPDWLNDKEVCQYNSHGDVFYTKEMAIKYIQSVQSNSTCKVFAICLNEGDRHIGNISLQQISQENRSAEFAILMGEKEFWGTGLAKEAGEILIKYGFESLGVRKIYCGTSKLNIPMQKLAKKLNMNNDTISCDVIKYIIFKNNLLK